MRRAVLAIILFLLFLLPAGLAAAQSSEVVSLAGTIGVDEIRPGMTGVAYTVFEGVKPEPMEVEVLGVLVNINGPKGNVILIRLHGKKVEYTGVVAGMSGSPVYIEGKLAGALAFRIGEFSKEPIAGVTPIREMLEINELDAAPAAPAPASASLRSEASPASAPDPAWAGDVQAFASSLQPIEAPLVFSGFSEETLRRFAPQLAAAGIVPVMGMGSVSGSRQPEPLEPGSAVSAVLVRGDMNIAATCTVTYLDPKRLLACGHPILQFGHVDLPMYKARVLATLPSPFYPFKIVNVTEPVGAFVQDRHTGILGHFGEEAQMIPVTLSVHGAGEPKQFHYEILNEGRITPIAMMVTVFQALFGLNAYGEDVTCRLNGHISVAGFPAVNLNNMFAPGDGVPTSFMVAMAIGERFNRVYENPYVRPDIREVNLDFDLVKERRWALMQSARTDVTEARPGDEIVVEAVLQPYRGEPIVRQIPVRIPTSTPHGPLHILVSDGDSLDRLRHMPQGWGRKLDMAATIALLNDEHPNTRVYVSLLDANLEALVGDTVMPGLPLSVMSVIEGLRRTQDMIVLAESSINEASTPIDYAVSGAQVITINVK
jgi:hypothetical protein